MKEFKQLQGMNLEVFQKILSETKFDEIKTDYDKHNAELRVKYIKALTEIEKLKQGYENQRLEWERLELDKEKLKLEKFKAHYETIIELAGKTDKQIERIGDLQVGLLEDMDEQVVKLLDAAQKLCRKKSRA